MTTERFPIEVGHILMFARAIGDPSTIYSDSVYAASSEVGGDHRPADVRPRKRTVRPRLRLAPEVQRAVVGFRTARDRSPRSWRIGWAPRRAAL